MQIELAHQPCLRNGHPAILAGAWVDLQAGWRSDNTFLASYAAWLKRASFDCLLTDWDGTGPPESLQTLSQLAAAINGRIVAPNAPAQAADNGFGLLVPPAGQAWAKSLSSAEGPHPAACAPGPLVVAWGRRIASGADHWSTSLFSQPAPSSDPLPAMALANLFHRLQCFARKQSELLLASQVVTDPGQFGCLALPPRVELVCRRLPGKPVWTVFVINPSLHPTVGPLHLKLGDREIDCGTVRLKAERFAVFQITSDRRAATNRHRPPAEIARQKGQSKADAARINDLLKSGLRIRTLFNGTEI